MFKKQVNETEKQQFRPRPSLPTSAYTSPRPVPKVPSISSSIRSVFSPERKNKRSALLGIGSPASASALSLRETVLSDTSSSQITSSYSHPLSLYDTKHMPIISSRDPPDEEAECPVCLEPLSFSFRLPGEKPHIVPECSHALHEVFHVSPHFKSSFTNCSSLPHTPSNRHVSPPFMVLPPVPRKSRGRPTSAFVGCVGDR